jgi:hypothetical protein
MPVTSTSTISSFGRRRFARNSITFSGTHCASANEKRFHRKWSV